MQEQNEKENLEDQEKSQHQDEFQRLMDEVDESLGITPEPKKKNKEKYHSFGDFILNDDKQVVKFLVMLSTWLGAVLVTALAGLLLYYGSVPFKIVGLLLTALAIYGWKQVYVFHKIKKVGVFEGLTANELVYGIKKEDKKND